VVERQLIVQPWTSLYKVLIVFVLNFVLRIALLVCCGLMAKIRVLCLGPHAMEGETSPVLIEVVLSRLL
jgi:hypothetical protein